MKAAVLYELKTPLKVEDVDLDKPKAREVRVKIAANGVCHSDYSVIHGVLRSPLPVVLGHEGAGIVEEVGPEVSLVKAGDHVVLSFAPYCGRCYYCAIGRPVLCENMRITMGKGTLLDGTCRLKKNGKDIHHMAGLSSFAQYAVVPEIACITIPNHMPLDKACLVGCGVMTGVGAAINTAKVEPGSSAVVVGCGGVGLNVIKGWVYGSARPRVDMPRLIDLYMNKKLKLDELVTRTYSLDEVNEAMTALEKGEVARSVVVM